MSTPSANQFFEAIHGDRGSPADPNLFTAAEIVAGSFDSAAVSTATSKAVSTVNAAAPDSTSISQAKSQAVSAASLGSIADSKALSGSVNTSVLDSKNSSGSVNTSVADSKAVSVATATPTLTIVAASQNVSIADSKATSAGATLAAYSGARPVFNVRDSAYGAVGNGSADDTLAIQNAAIAANAYSLANNTGASLYFPTGNYKINDTITINQHRVHVHGDGKYATTLTFNPTSAKALFKVQLSTAAEIVQGSFRQMGIVGGGTQQKIAFDCVDISEFVFQEIIIGATWTGNSGSASTPSIGLRISGRDVSTFSQLDIFADRPFHFRNNPNQPLIGVDHFHFTDIYQNALVSTEAGFLFDSDCVITSITWDGYQAWVGGTYGVYAQGSPSCISVNVHSVRYEQPGATGGFAFRWEASTTCIQFSGCNFGGVPAPTNGGVKLRNCRQITFTSCAYTGSGGATAIALDVDATCEDIWFINTFFQTTSLVNDLTLFTQVLGAPKLDSGAPVPATSYYYRTASAAVKSLRLFQTDNDFVSIDVASGATLNLSTNSQSMAVAILSIAGYSATGPVEEGGVFMITASSAKAIAVTANCAVGNVPTKLCVLWNSSASTQILNNTAQTLKLVFHLQWRT